MQPCINLVGSNSTFWMKCVRNNCETYVDTYVPLPFQNVIHTDPHKYVGIFGGYGSGKTTTGLKDDEKHMLSTPNGSTAVGSAILRQVEITYEKDFQQDCPVEFVLNQNKTKKTYTLINGHMLYVNTFYDEELIRSLNVTRFHIVEASAVDYSVFTQLQARMRNTAATIPELTPDGDLVYDPETGSFKVKTDWRRGIIESNPDAGWIRSSYLLQSSQILLYGKEELQQYFVDKPNEYMSSHIIPTKANKYLPPNFYNEQAKNKPLWWIRRFLHGSFDYAEGMVYPEALRTFCKPFVIPRHWKRVIAMDYGIRDATAILFGAIDKEHNRLYIYHEIYVNDVDYKVISRKYKEFCDNPDNIPAGSLFRTPVMDARSINKRNDRDLITIGDMFLEEGIFFDAAQMDIDSRVLKVNTMINGGQLFIFSTCSNLCREIKDYKFPERSLDAKLKQKDDKPEDKKNHAINALEFICMEVPYDMRYLELNAYHGSGKLIETHNTQVAKQTKNVYDPFSTPEQEQYTTDDYGDFGEMFKGGDIPW